MLTTFQCFSSLFYQQLRCVLITAQPTCNTISRSIHLEVKVMGSQHLGNVTTALPLSTFL